MNSLTNFIKSVYFNFRYLPLKQAIYMPIWVTTNLRLCKLSKGQIILKKPYRKSIFIGACGSPGLQEFKAGIIIAKGGHIIMNGMTVISEGTVLRCDKGAVMEFGSNFYCNKNCFLRTASKLSFGDGCSLGWNVQMNTNDGHPVWHDGKLTITEGPITIGNYVWITSNVIVGKNVNIADGCVIAQGAVVTKSIEKSNSLVGGVPAVVKKRNIRWEK